MNLQMSFALKRWDEMVRKDVSNSLKKCLKLLPKQKSYAVIDVGSNTGVFTEELAKKISIGKAILFEPIPVYAEWSKEKFLWYPAVKVFNYALSDKEERKTLYCSNQNLGWNTFIEEETNEENKDNALLVECKVFDELNETELKLEKIDLIKIDTEGFEYAVLAGMLKTLKKIKKKPLIVCEVGWGNKHPRFKKLEVVLNKIKLIGYNIPPISFSKTQDIFLVPSR